MALKRNPRLWVGLYLLAALVQLVAEWRADASMEFAVKPLLMPFLFGYFVRAAHPMSSAQWMVALGLIFAWAGDVALLPWGLPGLFLLGLGFFLVTHLLYLRAMLRWPGLSGHGALRRQPWLALPIVLALGGFLYVLWPGLEGGLRWPVVLYACVITAMLIGALHLRPLLRKGMGWVLVGGAFLFWLSDSLIGLSRFGPEGLAIPKAGFWIMLTYMGGQGLIAWALTKDD